MHIYLIADMRIINDTYVLFTVGVHIYLYHIFLQNVYISVQFVEIKCVELGLTLQAVNTEFETIASMFSKIVTNTCFHDVYNVNTSRTL